MNPSSKHILNLKPGDRIVWLDKPCEVVRLSGRIEVYLRPGMVGRVVSIHDGSPSFTVGESASEPPWAVVKLRNGHKAIIDTSMRWKKVN